jgi:Zn-dependent protease with chaperone function
MSPGLLADSLEKLLASHPESSKAGYLSSHPSTDERMRHLRQLAASFSSK